MVIKIERPCRRVWIQDQRVSGAAGYGVTHAGCDPLNGLQVERTGAIVGQIIVEGQSGQKWGSAGQSARRRRSCNEADVGLRENVLIVIGQVHTPLRLSRQK